ncbi:MAG: hypothetical protein LBD52_01725 [Prevotellaceae bacterium]|jgi:hypothetical protein|nr:hypothetical protein [Prevotellaceae bacterium]
MIYRAINMDIDKFLSLPETGMGYQIIEALVLGKSHKNRFVVYNSELIIDDDDCFNSYKRQLITKGFSSALNEARTLDFDRNSISLIPSIREARILNERKKENKHRYSGGVGAKDGKKENANGSDIFIRLSAYKDDRRIDFYSKQLKAGSFATTQQDYLDCVKYTDDPIDRYALPNDESIKWAFYIKPKSNDILQRGIVQPANKHDGGGIEVYFETGTSHDTYIETRDYGK